MSRKSGTRYADQVRVLRKYGFDFPASRGYTLGNAANWKPGQKAAVTKAYARLAESADEIAPDRDESDREFWNDSAGDNFEEWDDIFYFDYDEIEEFRDDEADEYPDE